MAARAKLVVVLGSVTPPGRLRRALEEAIAEAEEQGGVEAELLDLAELRVAFADGRDPAALGDDTEAVVEAVGGADAVILATPVYRGSMTGALKNLLDQLPVPALEAKPVGLVAMGGSPHHFLGAERHFRDVLAFFGARVLPVAVYLTSGDFADGKPLPTAVEPIESLLVSALATAAALKDAPPGPPPLAAAPRSRPA